MEVSEGEQDIPAAAAAGASSAEQAAGGGGGAEAPPELVGSKTKGGRKAGAPRGHRVHPGGGGAGRERDSGEDGVPVAHRNFFDGKDTSTHVDKGMKDAKCAERLFVVVLSMQRLFCFVCDSNSSISLLWCNLQGLLMISANECLSSWYFAST